VTLTRPVAKGAVVSWSDVKVNAESQAMTVRREMESRF
jgi:predicted homoserine dehydrogenase-like protein